MNIDFANLQKAYRERKGEIKEVSLEVMSSARYILGKETEEFEKNLREFLGCDHALACSSGTDALPALGICSKDEVITTPFTFIATAETIAFIGAKSVFVDINGETYNIDPYLTDDEITYITDKLPKAIDQ